MADSSETIPLRFDEGYAPPPHAPQGCAARRVRAVPMALAVLGLVLLTHRVALPPHARSDHLGVIGLTASTLQHTDILDPATTDPEKLNSHQFESEEAADSAGCHDAQHGEVCFNAIQFAMNEGIKHQPGWYPGLDLHSDFKEFQQFLFEEGRSSCAVPCGEGHKPAPPTPDENEHGHGGAGGDAHAPHVHGYLSLLFLLGGLSIGCVLQVVQERLLPAIPYTCLLFLTGLLLACIHELRPSGHWSSWPTWYISVSMWEQVDPHLIFYVFLPLLVFAEAMRLNIKLAMKLFAQVLLLAVPGVIMGAVLTAIFSHYVLPYGWSWATCMVFGAILAATDPVAVVALFNTLGVSPRLTMLVSGESLLNDGTAIVLFTLMLQLMLGKEVTPASLAALVGQMTLISVVLGVALACTALLLISQCAETKFHSDPMIQVCVTICLSMLCFFVAESEVKTSGVLTVVAAGCVVSHYAWPRFASRETMHIVWEAVEFLGNTVVFLLAGLLFGHRCLTRYGHLGMRDFSMLLALYVAVTVIRAVMVLLLWPFMNLMGQKVTWQEALVMVWSGLRGAVGLVLAIVVDEEKEIAPQIGSLFMFHIGGIAMLTIIVNATLCAPLLRGLGLTTPPDIDHRLMAHFEGLTHKEAEETLGQLQNGKDKEVWAGADMTAAQEQLDSMRPHHTEGGILADDKEQSERSAYRETFMRFVQSQYWAAVEDGLVPRTSRVARVLLYSAADSLLRPEQTLTDWQVIVWQAEEFRCCPCLNRCIASVWPLSESQWLQSLFPSDKTTEMWKVYLTLVFLNAHRTAREELPPYFEGCDALKEEVRDRIHKESLAEAKLADTYLSELSPEAVKHGKGRMLAGKLLHVQLEKVSEFAKLGILDGKGASHIAHRLQAEHRKLAGTSIPKPDSLSQPGSSRFF